MTGWVTIDNKSGKTYKSTKLKLIAGEVNRINRIGYNYDDILIIDPDYDTDGSSMPKMSHQSFSDFHMYTLS